ncbi:PLP-dependent transferase [Geminisphaera colitermitum]|uniref:PLP-dependent transferase n=1 Tax=Geminisphaera colitermitum TaxID=1148786 RepID=UPI000158CDE2|nr:PLP-dependent transferase [Geminisphaera colitermitum]
MPTTTLTHLPLGQRIPDRLHGVSCSLPTMRAVIGYEEKHSDVVARMTSGYPRFVVHPLIRRAAAHLMAQRGDTTHDVWLATSLCAATALIDHLADPRATLLSDAPLPGVLVPRDREPELSRRAKTFLQNTGTFLSSRAAEDYLVREGVLPAIEPEAVITGPGAERHVINTLAGYYGGEPDDVFIAPSGMNAIHATLTVATRLQRARNPARRKWVQLGWLYLDTIALLEKHHTAAPGEHITIHDAANLVALRELFAREGAAIAGVFAEVPTNPLVQTPDVSALAALCREHGALLVLDTSVVSPLNLNVLPHADVVVQSLTKYTASEGDVLMGAVVVNAGHPHAAAFRDALPETLEPVYPRDIARLAAQIGDTPEVIAQINRTAPRIVEFLKTHPAVDRVYWTGQYEMESGVRQGGGGGDSGAHYAAIARTPQSVGGMVSFTLKPHIPLEQFYDRVRFAKGPSFGMKTTLISPFIYLAHYDLVTSESGRAQLAAAGIPVGLFRLCIGCEPADELVDALAEALA